MWEIGEGTCVRAASREVKGRVIEGIGWDEWDEREVREYADRD